MKKLLLVIMSIVLTTGFAFAQRTLTGTITDEQGVPLSGATISAIGGVASTTTNSLGRYSLNLPKGAKQVEVSYVGYATQRISIGSSPDLLVKMQITNSAMENVIITGYQTIRKTEFTGSSANVAGSELAQKPMGSFTQLLQGKATGVQITGVSGRPGANSFIRIRGTGSVNASSEPLIIVDGIPVTTAAYNLLSANDIENISVLKDASAAAIYGSRGANGVLVISTKRGSAGKPELRYSFQYGHSNAQELKNVSLMNAQEKLQYEYDLGYTNAILDSMIQNRGYPAGTNILTLTAAQRQDLWNLIISRGAGDWRQYLLPEGTLKTHEIALSGADDKFKYYFSLNKSNQEGNEYKSYWNRESGRLNIEYKAKEWFRIGSNLSLAHTKENQVREPFNTQNSYASLFLVNPYEPVYLKDGITRNPTLQGFSSLEGADNNPQEFQRVAMFGTLFGEVTALKHLTLKSQIGANYNTFKEEYYIKAGSNLATLLGVPLGQKRDGGNQDLVYVFTNTANWRQSFNQRHNINILVGQEFNKDKFYSYSLTARVFPTPSVTTLDNAGTPNATSTSRSDWSLISYFGNASYDYNRKYFLNISGRRDGSSRFGKDNRFANFWAVGTAWDITKENFFKVNTINTLKIKASVGTAGNFNIGNYTSYGTYALTTKYNDLPVAVPSVLPNADLTWETNRNYDIGLDFGLFNNRISGTLDYYRRKTEDLLYPVNVSLTTGFTSYQGNVGSVENKGFEVLLAGDIISKRDLKWNVSVSYTHNDNKVTKLYSDNVANTGTGGLGRLIVGQPINVFYLTKWAGVDPATGKQLFYKLDGTTSTTYSAGYNQVISGKSPNVKYYGSINTDVTYKGFDLSAQLYYSGGNYVMNYMWQVAASDGEDPSVPQFTEASNFWKKPGDNVLYPNPLDPTQNTTFDTDKYLQKGDYISLRDVTLGYTLSLKTASKIYLKGLHVYVQGTNLWLGTKFKGTPEIGNANSESTITAPGTATLYAYPPLKAITFGIDVKF